MEPEPTVQRHQMRRSAIVNAFGVITPALHGEILNMREGETQIWLDQPMPYGSLVRIEYDDDLVLGEVVYCQQEESGWLVGVRVEHTLLGLKARAHMGGR